MENNKLVEGEGEQKFQKYIVTKLHNADLVKRNLELKIELDKIKAEKDEYKIKLEKAISETMALTKQDKINIKIDEEVQRLKGVLKAEKQKNKRLKSDNDILINRLLTSDSKILGVEEAWPLIDVLKKLVESANILLNDKNYDGHDWELILEAREKAREKIKQIIALKTIN